jgi:hypothetical protein
MLLRKRKSWIRTCGANPALKYKKEISLLAANLFKFVWLRGQDLNL